MHVCLNYFFSKDVQLKSKLFFSFCVQYQYFYLLRLLQI